MKESVSNPTTMGKRLGRLGEVRIVDETNCFGLDFVEKAASRCIVIKT